MKTSPAGHLTLHNFIRQTFLPERCHSTPMAYQYKAVATWLRRALRREATVSDLNERTLAMLVPLFESMGTSKHHANMLRKRYITLWHFAAERSLCKECPFKAGKRSRAMPPPIGAPGTVLAFFHDRYLPEILAASRKARTADYWTLFRALREWRGGDILLDTLDAPLLAQFLAYLRARKLNPATIKARRDRLVAVWRYAADCGLARPVPRLPKIALERNAPEAWSREEFGRILAAAGQLVRPPIHGVPANLFWPALLRCGYWTALRRGALLRLKPEDVDLPNQWIYVAPTNDKAGRGRRYRIGADAVEALRRIWDASRELIFPAGPELNWKFLDDHFRAILKLAGVPRGRAKMSHFHQLRRTAVTLAYAAGGELAAIELAGHSGKAVNERYIDVRYLPVKDFTRLLPAPDEAELRP